MALCQGQTFGIFTDFSICSFMTIVDNTSSWWQETKSQEGSVLKRFRSSSDSSDSFDWQIEEFKGTRDYKKESDLPTESFCYLVFFQKNFVQGASF